MIFGEPPQKKLRILIESIGPLILIASLILVARYWNLEDFGLYEDDYTRIPIAIGMTGSEIWQFIKGVFLRFGEQGRPFHPSLIYFLSSLGGKIGGLTALYWIGYGIIVTNAILFYTLLKRYSHRSIALLSGLSFALFSADTTQAFLTHSLGVQPSLLFFLLACHFYLSGRRLLSYLLVLISLLCYETIFPVFLAIPLLKKMWNSKLAREILIHGAILSFMLIAVFIGRILTGEDRIAGLELPSAILTSVTHMFQGPIVSMGTYLYRPIQTLLSLDTANIAPMILFFPVFILIFSRLNLESLPDFRAIFTSIRRKEIPSTLKDEFAELAKLIASGLIMLTLAYPLTFTVRAYAISGIATRVHFAAVVGASIAWGCISIIILLVTTAVRKRFIGTLINASIFTLLVGFGFIVQTDYRNSWEFQKALWTDVVQLAPDITDGTVILIDPQGLQYTRYIDANTWNLPRILNQIFVFPNSWEEPPRVYRLHPSWQPNIVTEEGLAHINHTTVSAPSDHFTVVHSTDVILLETTQGGISRRSDQLEINGIPYPFKDTSTGEDIQFDKGILYDYLIHEPAQ
jgi:hypothetical protein